MIDDRKLTTDNYGYIIMLLRIYCKQRRPCIHFAFTRFLLVKERKLNYRFYNLNTVEATTDILLKVFIEAKSEKVEKAIQEATKQLPEDKECDVGHLA